MGAVYEVRLPDDPRRLVAKVPTLSSEEARKRFQREGEVVARLDTHPHIVGVHAAGELPDGKPYLLFDYVHGESLHELLRQRGPLPEVRVVSLGIQLADALTHAHARGVLHRDVKPENVLLDEEGRALLADFGLALASDLDRLTHSKQALGTPGYMAPEQARAAADEQGPWTDVHALGLVLFEAIAGESAFRSGELHEVYDQVLHHQPPPLRELRPEVSAGLEEVVARCLEKDPARRYPHGAALAEALRRLSAGGGARAPRPRSGVSAALAGAVLALGGLGGAAAYVLGSAPGVELGAPIEAAQAALENHGGPLERGQAPGPEQAASARSEVEAARLQLEELLSGDSDPDGAPQERALVGRLLLLEGELALHAGDLELARIRLEQARALGDDRGAAPLRALARLDVVPLQAALAALDVEAGRSLPNDELLELLRALSGARNQWPQRVDLHVNGAVLALEAGRPQEAATLVELADAAELGPVPLELRFRVALRTENLAAAQTLDSRLIDDTLRAELHYLLAGQAVEESDFEEAAQYARRALDAAPDSSLRQDLVERVRRLVDRASRWRPAPDGDHESQFLAELDANELLAVLDPGHVAPPERQHALEVVGWRQVRSLHKHQGLDLLQRLIPLCPDEPQLYLHYANLIFGAGIQPREVDLEVLREGMACASPDVARNVTIRLAVWLGRLGRREELGQMVQSRVGVLLVEDPDLAAVFLGTYAEALRRTGDPDQALGYVERALELAPFESRYQLALFLIQRDRGSNVAAQRAAWVYIERLVPEAVLPGDVRYLRQAVAFICEQAEAGGKLEDAVRALDSLLALRSHLIQAALQRLDYLCQLEVGSDRLLEAIDGLNVSITNRSQYVSRFYRHVGLSSEEAGQLVLTLAEVGRERLPRLRRYLAEDDVAGLRIEVQRLRAELPADQRDTPEVIRED
jgi:tetratricopeptide (TPR) repeat protein